MHMRVHAREARASIGACMQSAATSATRACNAQQHKKRTIKQPAVFPQLPGTVCARARGRGRQIAMEPALHALAAAAVAATDLGADAAHWLMCAACAECAADAAFRAALRALRQAGAALGKKALHGRKAVCAQQWAACCGRGHRGGLRGIRRCRHGARNGACATAGRARRRAP